MSVPEYCREILPHVSRTFAITIPVLREPLRTQVGLAYLVCRIVDTVEDHPELDHTRRDALMETLRGFLFGGSERAWTGFLQEWPQHPDPYHQDLIEHTPELLTGIRNLPDPATRAITECLQEMSEGMGRFPGPTDGKTVAACRDLEDLERYCHFVAGTVGVLLCRLFRPAVGDKTWMDGDCVENGRRFGLGLQLTNILKDHESDRTRGVTYIPTCYLNGESPGAEISPTGLGTILDRALEHLTCAQRYIVSLPPERPDMRLFCLWAQHLALATLQLIALGDRSRTKVSRDEVRHILERARSAVGDDARLNAIFDEHSRSIRSGIGNLISNP